MSLTVARSGGDSRICFLYVVLRCCLDLEIVRVQLRRQRSVCGVFIFGRGRPSSTRVRRERCATCVPNVWVLAFPCVFGGGYSSLGDGERRLAAVAAASAAAEFISDALRVLAVVTDAQEFVSFAISSSAQGSSFGR